MNENIQINHLQFAILILNNRLTDERDQDYAERIQNDEFFYPLVLINDEVVGEGYIQIKPVFKALEKLGFVA